jgi:hypothetical protein
MLGKHGPSAAGERAPPSSTSGTPKRNKNGEEEVEKDKDVMEDDLDCAQLRIAQVRIEDTDLPTLVHRVLTRELAAIRQTGSSPRSRLERAAQEILAKLSK